MRAVVEISIGRGRPARVVLDTGSAGLRVLPRALGDNATSTAEMDVAGFPAGLVRSAVVETSFSIGGVSTGPIRAGVIQDSVCRRSDGWHCDDDAVLRALLSGTDGILGIAPANTDVPAAPLFSPLLQLPQPFGVAYAIQFAPGRDSYLTLGSAGRVQGSVAIPLRPTDPPRYPNGAKSYRREVDLCWRIDGGAKCGATSIDIGAPRSTISHAQFPDVPVVEHQRAEGGTAEKILRPGTGVEIRDSRSSLPIWSIVAGVIESSDRVLVDGPLADNFIGETGIPIFYSHVIGFDADAGEIIISDW